MKTLIMAGGKGTRISEMFPDIPKPMVPIDNKPILEWEICSLRNQGFKDILITVSYMADKIMSYFGNGTNLGVNIEYFVEESPIGNAGALFKLRDVLTEDFLLLNADAIFDVDFNRMVDYHRRKNALVTIFSHPNSHPYDSGLIVTDGYGMVKEWLTKEDSRPKYYKNRVNAGLHVINPIILDMGIIDAEQIGMKDHNGDIIKVDLDREVLKPLCQTGRMYAYDSPEYVKDMGTPSRYESACRDFAHGIVASKNLSRKQRAIFLDRDGTINNYVGFLRDINEFELLDGVSDAISRINESGYLAIIITNQPVVARGEVTIEELQNIHNKMETLLGYHGAYIDGVYYCPHHPDKGYEGEIIELKVDCDCRKPKPGMIYRAAKDFNIELSSSWVVGDSENDIKAGMAAGCKTALIANVNKDYGQDKTVRSLKDFVDQII